MEKRTSLSGNPESWTPQDRKRFEDFCKTIAFMRKALEDNGFLVRRHIMRFRGGEITYTICFGGYELLDTNA